MQRTVAPVFPRCARRSPPWRPTRGACFRTGDADLCHRIALRAGAFAFRDRDGPVTFDGVQSSVSDGGQTQGDFDGIRIGGGGASASGRDDGLDIDVPLPTAAPFVVLGLVALCLSRLRFV